MFLMPLLCKFFSLQASGFDEITKIVLFKSKLVSSLQINIVMPTLKLHLLLIKMIFMQNYNRQKIVTMRSFALISTLCMIPAAFIQIIIDDRISELLHLQIINGLKKKTYWIAQFIYDMVLMKNFHLSN